MRTLRIVVVLLITAMLLTCDMLSYVAGYQSKRDNPNDPGAPTPDPPSELRAIAVSSTQINLTWTDNSTNEAEFKIERKVSATGSYSQIASVRTNEAAYSDAGLIANTTYYYRIRAGNSAGDSPYSNEVSATPVVAGTQRVSGVVSYSGTPLSGIGVDLIKDDLANQPLAHTSTANGQYAFEGLESGHYWIKVYGPTQEYVGWVANDCDLLVASVVVDFDLPKRIVLTTPENGNTVTTPTTTLGWTSNPQASQYILQLNVTSTWELIAQVYNIPYNYYTLSSSLITGTNYTWQVDALDLAGRHVGTTDQAFSFTYVSSPGGTALPIGQGAFSGNEIVEDYDPNFGRLDSPVMFNGVTYTSLAGGEIWSDIDWSLNGFYVDLPTASGGFALNDTVGHTDLQIDFSTPVNRVGVLASTSLVTTFTMTAFNDSLLSIGSVTSTMPADSRAVFLGLQADVNIKRIVITEPIDNGQISVFDDLRREPVP